MEVFNDWKFWAVLYLLSSITFSQTFKRANRNMQNAGSLTILLEVFTALFAILFIPFFNFTFPTDINVYITLFIVICFYAATDRLNIEARYGLEPSMFSMLKQLSTVFLVIFSFMFLNEPLLLKKVMGALIIVVANIILAMDKGKIKFNKYFIMCFVSNFLFAIAMLLNVNISENFNLGFYTILTVFLPSIIITLFGRHSLKGLINEFNLYDKPKFLISAFCWCIMLVSSVRAYQLGNVSVVAPILTLTSILNTLYEYFILKDRKQFLQKLFCSILIIIGIILIRL